MIIDPMLLDQQLCFALYAATHAITRCYSPGLKALGLTYPQYLVMLVLWQQDDVTVTEIGSRLQLDSGTLTPLLKRLEGSGLVARHRDKTDERQVRIQLTEKGTALRDRARKVPAEIARLIDRPLAEIMALRSELSDLRAALEKAEG